MLPPMQDPSTYDKVTRIRKPEMIQATGYCLFSLALIDEKNLHTILSRRICTSLGPYLN